MRRHTTLITTVIETIVKVKRSRKDPFILDQIWFIFNKVTNYVKNITPELVSLKIGAFFLV